MPIIDASWVPKSGVAMTWREQLDEPDPDPDAEQRHEDRETHRDQRSERDQQDHDGGEDADELGRSEAAELLEHAPAERDAHAPTRRRRRRGARMSADGGGRGSSRPCGRTAPWRRPRRRRARPAGHPRRLYGLTTAATCGTSATSANSASMRCCTAGSCTPPAAAKTIWPSSPAWAGNRDCRRSVARCDSVPDRWKPCENVAPTLDPTALTATSATIHRTTTRRRRR